MKQRNVALCIIFTLITCGIYGIYWLVVLNNDINTLSERNGSSGGMVVLLSIVTCGIYLWYWMYKMGEAVDNIREKHGESRNNTPIVYLLLSIFGLAIVSYALMQSEINKYSVMY